MNLRLAAFLFLLGLPGPVLMAWWVLPALTAGAAAPGASLQAMQIATVVQGAVLLAVSSLLGSALAPKVQLGAPVLSALLAGRGASAAARAIVMPALWGGVAGGAIIAAAHALAPAAWAAAQAGRELPLAVRVLYGGITEEVLLRWGFMTLLAWIGWRVAQRGRAPVSPAVMGTAIALSALVFGASHLPAAAASGAGLSAPVVLHVVGFNTLFGLVAGALYWRRGLEAAMGMHAIAHLVAYGVALPGRG